MTCPICRAGRLSGLPLCIRHLEMISLAQYRIQTGWLTPAQVCAMKASGALPSCNPSKAVKES